MVNGQYSVFTRVFIDFQLTLDSLFNDGRFSVARGLQATLAVKATGKVQVPRGLNGCKREVQRVVEQNFLISHSTRTTKKHKVISEIEKELLHAAVFCVSDKK